MKKTIIVVLSIMFTVALMGCGGNDLSSQVEAIHEASQIPNFKKIISVESVYASLLGGVRISGLNGTHSMVHVIIYERSDGEITKVYYDGMRPPKKIK